MLIADPGPGGSYGGHPGDERIQVGSGIGPHPDTAAYRLPPGVQGSLRRASPALSPGCHPNHHAFHPLEIQERHTFRSAPRFERSNDCHWRCGEYC